MALNMLRLDAKVGEICFLPLIFIRGHIREIGIATLPMELKPRHVEKFGECRLTDVGESQLTDEKGETYAKHIKIAFVEREI